MPRKIIEVEGVAGTSVQRITVANEFKFRAITVWFSDQTAIHFDLHPRIEAGRNSLTGQRETVKH
jgi:hypothetical protein